MAYFILRDPSEAEEVTADTVLTAWHKIGSLRDPDVAGLSVPEIAEAVVRSQNTVKSQIREGLARMRRELGEEAGTDQVRAEEWS